MCKQNIGDNTTVKITEIRPIRLLKLFYIITFILLFLLAPSFASGYENKIIKKEGFITVPNFMPG